MKSLFAGAAAMALLASPAFAALETGAAAPDLTANGFKAGEPITFNLSEALQDGPVVLYFFPAAFTPGCNLEAKAFSDRIAEFEAEGATVIGVTAGAAMDDQMSAFASTDEELQARMAAFSTEHCQDKFGVAAVGADVVTAYDVASERPGRGVSSSRTSYVIAPDGTVQFALTEGNFQPHIDGTLEALKAYNAEHGAH